MKVSTLVHTMLTRAVLGVVHCHRLSYDEWTSILPDKAIPPQAQTDLPLGKARIPKHWSLKLVTMPSIDLSYIDHDQFHLAHTKFFSPALITNHHRIARIFW